jgi:hypothetical protein
MCKVLYSGVFYCVISICMTRILITSDCQPIEDYKSYASKLGLNVDWFKEYEDYTGNKSPIWQMLVAPHPKLNFFILRLDGRYDVDYSAGAQNT